MQVNVATTLMLTDFDIQQVQELNRRFPNPVPVNEVVDLYDLLGGHPFLIRRALESISGGECLAEFVKAAGTDGGPFGDHLRRILQVLASNSPLLQAVQAFLAQKTQLSTEEFFRLRTAGVFSGDRPADARPRCRLYAEYLARHLAPVQMRQRA